MKYFDNDFTKLTGKFGATSEIGTEEKIQTNFKDIFRNNSLEKVST